MRPILLLTLLSACAPIDPDVELKPFESCEQMQKGMEKMARQEVLYDWRWHMEVGFLGGSKDFSLDAGESSSGATSYSTTNVQEQGVDEADLMKTDGNWIYSLSGNAVVVTDAWPEKGETLADMEQVAVVEIDGYASGLYLYGEMVVVESVVYDEASPRSGARPEAGGSGPRTLLTLIDVRDPASPSVLREVYATGVLVESRRIDNLLYLVTYQDIRVTEGADNARQAKRMVREAASKDWLPVLSDNRFDGSSWATSEDSACACTDVWASEREGGTWLVTALSFDLDDPTATPSGSAVVGEAETVYASTEAIYVASNETTEGPFPNIDDSLQTILHKFRIGEGRAKPEYVASAKILGTLEDRFGLSERDGVLRAATTEFTEESSSLITTLAEQDGQFVQLDSEGGLGAGEQIFATRFVDDMGYVVTFEQIDPLYTIDLSDPYDIQVAGELKVEGFSDYLHPMQEGYLLAVGLNEDWQLQVSLFDVRDKYNPVRVDEHSFDSWGSESMYESHAFNWFAPQGALVIPADGEDGQPGLEVTRVTTEGFDYVGRMEQAAVLDAYGGDEWCVPVRRSIIMEEELFAISEGGITAGPLAEPWAVEGAAVFEDVTPCEEYYYYYDDDSW